MANLTPRLPVHGRRHPTLNRLAIGLPFGQNPPTGFVQVAGDRFGRFTVSFGSPQPLIQRHYMRSLQSASLSGNAAGGFDEGPLR